MNMIFCNSKCIHQADGVCQLERTLDVLSESVTDEDCCYFSPIQEKSQ
ncbi:MAG: hypothetical protein GX896_02445 [Clostridiales bacterium]|nr:hypothetical protein [Clostridiales bacterium]